MRSASRFSKSSHLPRPRPAGQSPSLARWRTDDRLQIVALHIGSALSPLPLPSVGQVISKSRRLPPFLSREAHLKALGGKSGVYRVSFGRQRYQVDLSPRYDRRKKIVGVRGILRILSTPFSGHGPAAPAREGGGPFPPGRPTPRSTSVRSLEIAQTIAHTAKLAAEARTRKALELQLLTEQALVKMESDERRARLLVDAGAILDSTPELPAALARVGELLIHRMADWWVLQLREDGGLRRVALLGRNPRFQGTLERLFPPEEKLNSAEMLLLGLPLVFPQDDPAEIGDRPSGNRRTDGLVRGGVTSFLRVPVRLHGRILGALTMGTSDPGSALGFPDARMAEDLASRIALARESSILYEEVQRELDLRTKAEAELRKLNAELEQRVSERTQLLQEANREANNFAYTVAHDLRAPLRAITGFSQVLHEDYASAMDETGKEYLERIVGSAQRMDELIRDLLEYARLNRTEITLGVVDLDELLTRTMQILAHESQERGARVRWQPPLGKVIGQEVLLSQALRNLLSNALKFVAPGVTPEVDVTTESRDGRVRIVVQDNGIGIAPEHHARIFGMFERLNTSDQYAGTGMGLAIVRRAAERLGGVVGLDSQAGQGSRFWIELPAAPPS